MKIFLLCIFATTLIAGCASPAKIIVPDPVWSASGLVNRRHQSRSFTAEIDISGDQNRGIAMQIGKHQSLLTLVGVDNVWRATGPLAGRGWSGRRENAPSALLGWITLAETLAAIRQSPPDVAAVVTGTVRAKWTDENAEVIAFDTGEVFRVIWR